ncbi:MAG: metalloregulator ArsR/SmtB family transcription factor [Verrucomicrobiota bacterium]
MCKYINKRIGRLRGWFRALGDPSRVKIFCRLCGCEEAQPVSEVYRARGMDVDLSVVSRHLAQMRDCGLVSAERRGRTVLYRANARAMAKELRELAEVLEECPCCDCEC